MQVKSIAEYSKRSILQYFRPSLSYHLLLRALLCLLLSGRFTQVLLYLHCTSFTPNFGNLHFSCLQISIFFGRNDCLPFQAVWNSTLLSIGQVILRFKGCLVLFLDQTPRLNLVSTVCTCPRKKGRQANLGYYIILSYQTI